MSQVGQEGQTWPGGLTYVFQGTIAEDATAGTHVCTLTITPGVGNEMQVLYGEILDGNTATSQSIIVSIDDGTNEVFRYISDSSTTAQQRFCFPWNPTAASARGSTDKALVSGAMRLILQVQTAAVSVTQTFAVVCRIHGAKPTAVLADTVGTPVLTTNTDAVF